MRRAVEDMLRRERAEQERQVQRWEPSPEQMTVSVTCDEGTTESIHLLRADAIYGWRRDIFTAATKHSNDLYAVTVQEVANSTRNAPRKRLLLRECNPDHDAGSGNWVGGAAFIVPVSKIEWLIGALEQAEQALEQAQQEREAEARANRQAGQQARRRRPPEEVDEEREQRQAWTQKRGREAWQEAVGQASRHKKRAFQNGLTNHFTAWQWLEMCDRFSFRCPLCRIAEGDRYPDQSRRGRLRARTGETVRFQPHHRRELSRGGDNTIENILPLCGDCHSVIHDDFPVRLDASPDWLEAQRALCVPFSPGMLVTSRRDAPQEQQHPSRLAGPELMRAQQQHYPPAWSVGAVIAVNPPERIEGKPGPNYPRPWEEPSYRYGLIVEENGISFWRPATVQVQWQRRGARENASVSQADASSLQPLDEETARWYRNNWAEEQKTNKMAFAVGDLVRPEGSLRTHRSQIIEILPANPVTLSPVRAIICNTAGKKERRTIEITESQN